MGGYFYPYTLLLHFKTSEMCNMLFYCWIFCILSLVVSNNKVHNYLLSSVHSYLFGNKDHFWQVHNEVIKFCCVGKIFQFHIRSTCSTMWFQSSDELISLNSEVCRRDFSFLILNIEYLTSWFSATYRNW